MEINPLQFAGALIAACIVLVIAKVKGDRQFPKFLPFKVRFSLSSLLIFIAIMAGILTLVGHALK